ncbi:response regulator receiver domain [Clostridium sp. BL-8]|uniref:response regulator receiver domain n=1 Tax=Clostridium sp. BL-8 TaxID=349938 RepID=UPI00098CA2FE|nr:response regulator receiver domain [Clostridium sp. BL-8]OOM79128.1 hypothetical protein CLOBL_18000 [Clostridium sp. BL-8]
MVKQKHMENAEQILAKYFESIIYIDDYFDIREEHDELDSEKESEIDKEEDDFDPTSYEEDEINGGSEQSAASYEVGNEDKFSNVENETDIKKVYNNIGKMLEDFKKTDLNVFPYIYIPKDENNIERLINFIEKSSLIILDWELEHGRAEKTLEILEEINKDSTLRFVIIYTNRDDLDNVRGAIESKFENCYNTIDDEKRIVRVNTTYIMISGKNTGKKLKAIINDFSETLVKKYGYLFVSFFNIAQQIRLQTGKVLNEFMDPFELLLMIQLKNTGIDELDYEEKLRNLVLSHLNDNIIIDNCIMEGIIDNYKFKIEELKNADFDNIKTNFKNWIKGKRIYEKHKIELENINEKFKKEHFIRLLDVFINSNLYLDDKNKRNDEFSNTLGIIKTEIALKPESKTFIAKYFEAFVLAGIFEDPERIESHISTLFKLMKLVSYTNCDLKSRLEQLIKSSSNKDEFERETLNLFNSGDILIHENGQSCLMCITPPCDVFRPKKVNYKVKFIEGIKITDYNKGEGNHLSILPLNNVLEKIEWRFYEEKIIDLNDKSNVECLKKYTRPYRMQKQYLQEILSKYFAFWSRSGVDEIFLKNKEHFLGKSLNELIME